MRHKSANPRKTYNITEKEERVISALKAGRRPIIRSTDPDGAHFPPTACRTIHGKINPTQIQQIQTKSRQIHIVHSVLSK